MPPHQCAEDPAAAMRRQDGSGRQSRRAKGTAGHGEPERDAGHRADVRLPVQRGEGPPRLLDEELGVDVVLLRVLPEGRPRDRAEQTLVLVVRDPSNLEVHRRSLKKVAELSEEAVDVVLGVEEVW